MKRLLFVALATFITVCNTRTSLAWGNAGHTVIAYYAEQLLDEDVKKKCHHYLRSTLAFQASWMDQYRSIEPFTECDKWHSTNIDANFKVVVGKPNTAAYQIERIRKEMANYKSMPDSLVRLNLRYLIHMIGDTHCPVHVRWSRKEHPEFHYSLLNKGRKYSYHGFWDSSLARWRTKWTAERYVDEIGFLSKGKAKKITKGTAYDWTQETADVARLKCFPLIPAGTEVSTLPQDKRYKIHYISEQQVQRAAYRLAAVLTEIFKE